MIEKGECFNCPNGQKIELYNKAAQDSELARELSIKQGIPSHPIEIIKDHYLRTAQTLLIGCVTHILCFQGAKNV